MNEPLS